MVTKLILLAFIFTGGSVGYNYLPDLFILFDGGPDFLTNPWLGLILGVVIGWFVGMMLVSPILNLIKKSTDYFSKQSISYILLGSLGLVLGLIISWLINISLVAFSLPIISDIVPIIMTIVLATIGFHLGSSRVDEIKNLISSATRKREDKVLEQEEDSSLHLYKVLDTSVIIDGRILDVVRTGFLEGKFIISDHVLQELQHIADSSDSLKRARGRRGLDILNALQKDDTIHVEMNHDSIDDAEEVDMKLVYLARDLSGVIVTNDYNLNKVAEFQNVPVLNINELANVVKPVVIPGETMRVLIVKNGTERQQGVAYLDDGTMVVVEEGKHHINEVIDVIVTSSLQTNAGRMIFANIDEEGRSLENQAQEGNKKNKKKSKKELKNV